MPPRPTPITDAVATLALPQEIARRLVRALDKYLARPSAGHHPYRQAVRASIGALVLDGVGPMEVRDRLIAAVAGHAEERGFYARSVVRGVPRYQRACDLVDRWVRELLPDVDDEAPALAADLVGGRGEARRAAVQRP